MLGLLNAVERDQRISQRTVARELGIALGLANAYLRRCVKKGYVKVTEVPARRYAYYLTPHGFVEKTRLTTEFLSQSLNLFRQTRAHCTDLLGQCHENGWTRIAIAGSGDVAEICILSARERAVSVLAILDPASTESSISGVAVMTDPARLPAIDAIIIADLRDPVAAYRLSAQILPHDRILMPKVLGVSRQMLQDMDAAP